MQGLGSQRGSISPKIDTISCIGRSIPSISSRVTRERICSRASTMKGNENAIKSNKEASNLTIEQNASHKREEETKTKRQKLSRSQLATQIYLRNSGKSQVLPSQELNQESPSMKKKRKKCKAKLRSKPNDRHNYHRSQNSQDGIHANQNDRMSVDLDHPDSDLLEAHAKLARAELQIPDCNFLLENLASLLATKKLQGDSLELAMINALIRKIRNTSTPEKQTKAVTEFMRNSQKWEIISFIKGSFISKHFWDPIEQEVDNSQPSSQVCYQVAYLPVVIPVMVDHTSTREGMSSNSLQNSSIHASIQSRVSVPSSQGEQVRNAQEEI